MKFLGLLSKHHALHTPLRHISLVENIVKYRQPKGQIKSEWINEVIDFTNQQLKYLKDFCPETFEVDYL